MENTTAKKGTIGTLNHREACSLGVGAGSYVEGSLVDIAIRQRAEWKKSRKAAAKVLRRVFAGFVVAAAEVR